MKGIGNDIVKIDRIRKLIERHQERFYHKIFTPAESAYCLSHRDSAIHFGGRFSAKEAVVKALGVGFGKEIGFLEVEIKNDPKGKPFVSFSDAINEKWNWPEVLISISHTEEYATAIALYLK